MVPSTNLFPINKEVTDSISVLLSYWPLSYDVMDSVFINEEVSELPLVINSYSLSIREEVKGSSFTWPCVVCLNLISSEYFFCLTVRVFRWFLIVVKLMVFFMSVIGFCLDMNSCQDSSKVLARYSITHLHKKSPRIFYMLWRFNFRVNLILELFHFR